jgi:hypothetical protein
MKGKVRRWWQFVAALLIVVAALVLLYTGWGSEHLALYGAYAVPLVALVLGWIASLWRARTSPAGQPAAGQDLDRVADLLAVAVKQQWEQAAGERGLVAGEAIPVAWGGPSLRLTGPTAAAVSSRRFEPLPGLAPASETQLAAGQVTDLHAVYGGLGSGRLVIAGVPGSGKTGAAVLLVLAALKHRDQVPAEDRPKVPVPVLFTAQNWDPRRQPVSAWLTGRLQETYPLFAGKTGAAGAAGLIAAGKIAVILDGLDEIAVDLRPVAVQALSEQASFRVVVLSRTAEMASAASQRGGLQGAAAIELRPIDAATAAGYLERVQLDPMPDGWRDLISRIRDSPGSPLANALDSPLTLTLIHDTYHSEDDAHELLDFCDATQQHVSDNQAVTEQIKDHLLDRVLPAAYAPHPGEPPPRYDLAIAQNALTKIAATMNQDGTRDLQWWRIPGWTSFTQRVIMGGVVFGVVVGLQAGLLVGLVFGLPAGLVGGLVGLVGGAGGGAPNRIGKLQMQRVLNWQSLVSVLVFGLVFGLLVGLGFGGGLVGGVGAGLGAGLMIWLLVGLVIGLTDWEDTNSPSPVISWRADRNYALMHGLVYGLGAGLMAGLLFGLATGLGTGLGLLFGLSGGLGIGLLLGLTYSQVWPSSLALTQLAMHWHTPLRLMKFLDDAHKRNVLRTAGPVYQFRHARLQDRLAGARHGSGDDSNTTTRLAHAENLPGQELWHHLSSRSAPSI